MPKLLLDGGPHLGGVGVEADGGVGDEGRRGAAGPLRPGLERWHGHIPQVWTGAQPGDGAVGLGAAKLEGFGPQGGGHHRHVQWRGQLGVGLIVLPVKVHRPLLQQRLADAQVLPQMAQGLLEPHAQGALHARLAAGAHPQPEAARRQLGQHLHLLGQGHRVAREELGHRSAQHNALGAHRGAGKEGEGVAAARPGAG